nr:uncharacterized protein LOC123002365 [Drosophila takahashii]
MCQCTPGCWVQFYSIWCIVLGIFVFVEVSYLVSTEPTEAPIRIGPIRIDLFLPIYVVVCLICVSYLFAGLFMVIGQLLDSKALFKTGKCLSYVLPIAGFLLILPAVVHAFAIVNMYKYQEQRWPKHS